MTRGPRALNYLAAMVRTISKANYLPARGCRETFWRGQQTQYTHLSQIRMQRSQVCFDAVHPLLAHLNSDVPPILYELRYQFFVVLIGTIVTESSNQDLGPVRFSLLALQTSLPAKVVQGTALYLPPILVANLF